ncbi:MAG TPA: Ku protein [Myxococcota bacterium]|nr:Ku protein [Myxococcota bacterium]
MSARAIWKGVVVLGKNRVPVKLLSAVEESDVHFRLLHEKDQAPVSQRMVRPDTGEEVPREQIQKGYEVERGTFVTFDKEELAALQPPESRDIEVAQLVPRGSVGSYWYERPYWLAADAGGAADYAALAAALDAEKRDGVVRWVMRGQSRVAVLRAHGGHLLLVTLRHTDEVVPPSQLEPPPGEKPDAKEMRLAEQLVSALEGRFEPDRYRDEYQARVRQLIEAKARGRKLPKREAPRRRRAPASLAGALEASLRGTRGRKSA